MDNRIGDIAKMDGDVRLCNKCGIEIPTDSRHAVCKPCWEKWKAKKIADGTWEFDRNKHKNRDGHQTR